MPTTIPAPSVATRLKGLLENLLQTPMPIRLRAWDGSVAGPEDAPTMIIRQKRALRRLMWQPNELGLARAYVSGDVDLEGDLYDALNRLSDLVWRSPDIKDVPLRAVLADALKLGIIGTQPKPPPEEMRVTGTQHSKRRDKQAVSQHYDVGNEFYRIVLGESMVYSCAYWMRDEAGYGLADAQRDKLDLICRKLDLHPGARLLDVGCGWGPLAVHAAKHYGAHVTGVTISAEQLAFGRARIAREGLEDLIELRLQDYRDIPADQTFDAVTAIEMGEHVGKDNYPAFLDQLHRRARPGGRVLIQQMSRGARHPGGGPFIERYIAPDMHMRPVADTVGLIEAAGFEVRDVHVMREHYVRTIEAWLRTFEQRFDEVVTLVGDEQARVWRLYLVGSALAFEHNRMGVDQILAVRTPANGHSRMPPTRSGWEHSSLVSSSVEPVEPQGQWSPA